MARAVVFDVADENQPVQPNPMPAGAPPNGVERATREPPAGVVCAVPGSLRRSAPLMQTAHAQPWMLGTRADRHDADARREIAAGIRVAGVGHLDWVLLETCHRVELYGMGPVPEVEPALNRLAGRDAVAHLMQVAAGLDSAIVGEDEVLHQVRDALRSATSSDDLDRRMQRLFETAVATGRNARSGRSADSANLAQSAIEWLHNKSPMEGRRVLIIGAGHMGAALAHKARQLGAHITIASRHLATARRLSRLYEADSADLAEAAELAPASDGIAIALSGPWRELQPTGAALPPIADISAPPAVDRRVQEMLSRSYLGIDELYRPDRPRPEGYAANATRIVEAKTDEYVAWLNSRS